MRLFSFLIFLLPGVLSLLAQTQTRSHVCTFGEHHRACLANDTVYARQNARGEAAYRQYVRQLHTPAPANKTAAAPGPNAFSHLNLCDPQTDILEFPVVVHIMHKGESTGTGSNRSNAWVDSMITQANLEWRNLQSPAKHPNMLANPSTDMRVQFRLARRAPNGNPTNGIVRVDVAAIWPDYDGNDAVNNIGGDDSLVALSEWPKDRYINIYIMAQESGSWAYFGGSAFISYTFPTSLGHELAHAFFIEHTFGDKYHALVCSPDDDCLTEGDGICDTPPHRNPQYDYDYPTSDCPPVSTWPGTPWAYSLYNVMSYYDLVDGAADVYLLTPGQRDKIRAMALSEHLSKLGGDALIPTSAQVEAGIRAVRAGCEATFQPQVEVANHGTQPIATATLECRIDGALVQTYNFVGSIASGTTATITLNPVTVTPDAHKMEVIWTMVNGVSSDIYPWNDQYCLSFSTRSQPGYPVTANMEGGALPANWQTYGMAEATVTDNYSCSARGDYMLTINSFPLDYWDLTEDRKRTIIDLRDKVDLRYATEANLRFAVAARKHYYCNYWKSLKVEVSDDCGETWATAWHKNDKGCSGPEVETALPLWTVDEPSDDPSSPFEPSDCTDWRNENVDLSPWLGKEVLVRFVHYGYEGNPDNVYLDDIALTRLPNISVAVEDAQPRLVAYPNPAEDVLHLTLSAGQTQVAYSLCNALGQCVQTGMVTGSNAQIPLDQLRPGCYLLRLHGDTPSFVRVVKE